MATLSEAKGPEGRLSSVEREGFAWVDLIASGKTTDADMATLERWRGLNPAHEEAFNTAVKVRALVGQHQRTDDDNYKTPLLERTTTRRAALGVGVGLVALAGYGIERPPLGLWPSLAELSSDYRTSTGERRQVALRGGVTMEMNARTSVALRSDAGQSGVELVAGEINIATSRTQRFVVIAGPSRIAVDEGAADVRLDSNGLCVTCLKGVIQIDTGGHRIELQPLHQIRGIAGNFDTPIHIDPVVVTAWQRGQLIFHDAPLSEVVAEINRYRPGRIVIASSNLAQSRFSGDFPVNRIDEAVRQIEKVAAKSATSIGGILILS